MARSMKTLYITSALTVFLLASPMMASAQRVNDDVLIEDGTSVDDDGSPVVTSGETSDTGTTIVRPPLVSDTGTVAQDPVLTNTNTGTVAQDPVLTNTNTGTVAQDPVLTNTNTGTVAQDPVLTNTNTGISTGIVRPPIVTSTGSTTTSVGTRPTQTGGGSASGPKTKWERIIAYCKSRQDLDCVMRKVYRRNGHTYKVVSNTY